MTDHRFADRVVIVTGAGSGIGRATALAFARAGADVLAVGRRQAALDETAGKDSRITTHAADITAEGAPAEVVGAAVERWGKLDTLVNNAGIFVAGTVDEVTAESIDRLHNVHVKAPSLLAAAAVPHLRETRGSIVNVSSAYGVRPLRGGSQYGGSKAAIDHLTRTWALELGPDGVRVNAVSPGYLPTEIQPNSGATEKDLRAMHDQEIGLTPVGRAGEPEDVATWILHAADPNATWFTGQVIGVDGGHVLR